MHMETTLLGVNKPEKKKHSARTRNVEKELHKSYESLLHQV